MQNFRKFRKIVKKKKFLKNETSSIACLSFKFIKN